MSDPKEQRRPIFKQGAHMKNSGYVIVNFDGKIRTNQMAIPLGYGNAGLVYRAIYRNSLHRVIKFLSPEPQSEGAAQAQIPLDIILKNFQKEISILCQMTHTHIAKIVDFGEYEENGDIFPYYVTDFVNGMGFEQFEKSCSLSDFVTVLTQIVDALVYLHSLWGYEHMDLKEENIIVNTLKTNSTISYKAVLLDLGAAKPILKPSVQNYSNLPTQLELGRLTRFISTTKCLRPEDGNKIGRDLPYSFFIERESDWDLYALGQLIVRAFSNTDNKMLSNPHSSEEHSTVAGLRWMARQLSEPWPKEAEDRDKRRYRWIEAVRDDLARLEPSSLWPLKHAELSLSPGEHSIQLSNERVVVTPELLDLINHPVFQRLRNLQQLEYLVTLYPSATHTRFEHSLHTFQIGRLFLLKLLDNPEFRMATIPDQLTSTLLLCLLHDLGHYPLSHMFEDFSTDYRETLIKTQGEDLCDRMFPTDHALFESIVNPGDDDPFANAFLPGNKLLRKEDEPLWRLLDKKFPRSRRLLCNIMYAKPDDDWPIPLLRNIIDSVIDVDKVAYLINDSKITGVPYGCGVDMYGILDNLILPELDDRRMGGLAIKVEGLSAAEGIVMARHWMIDRVYWHRVNRCIMSMHKYVIADLLTNGVDSISPSNYITDTVSYNQIHATAYLSTLYERKHMRDHNFINPLDGLVPVRRDLYAEVFQISNGPEENDKKLYQCLLEKVQASRARFLIEVCENLRECLNNKFPNLDVCPGEIIIDIPARHREDAGGNLIVYQEDGPHLLLGKKNSASNVLKGASEEFDFSIKHCRIFVHPRLGQKLSDDNNLLQRVRRELRTTLEEKYAHR